MTKEKFVRYLVYLVLSILILLFIMSVVAPQKFELVLALTEAFLIKKFDTSGWLLLLGGFLSFIGVIKLIEFMLSFSPKKLPYHKYRQDTFKNTLWKWDWKQHNIENLWCYCPECNQELSYKCDHLLFKTEFLCQGCSKHISSYEGDNINYVLSKVKREIRRLAQKQLQAKLSK